MEKTTMRNTFAAVGALLLGFFVFYACANWGGGENDVGGLTPDVAEKSQKAADFDFGSKLTPDIQGLVSEYADAAHSVAVCNQRPRVITEERCKTSLRGRAFLGRDGYYYELESASRFFAASLLRVKDAVRADTDNAYRELERTDGGERKGTVPDKMDYGDVDRDPTHLDYAANLFALGVILQFIQHATVPYIQDSVTLDTGNRVGEALDEINRRLPREKQREMSVEIDTSYRSSPVTRAASLLRGSFQHTVRVINEREARRNELTPQRFWDPLGVDFCTKHGREFRCVFRSIDATRPWFAATLSIPANQIDSIPSNYRVYQEATAPFWKDGASYVKEGRDWFVEAALNVLQSLPEQISPDAQNIGSIWHSVVSLALARAIYEIAPHAADIFANAKTFAMAKLPYRLLKYCTSIDWDRDLLAKEKFRDDPFVAPFVALSRAPGHCPKFEAH